MEGVFQPTSHSLIGVAIFEGLDRDARGLVAKRCLGHSYPAQQDIIAHHDLTRDIYFIISGRVRATIFSVHGKEVAFRDLGAGMMFGDLSAIDGKPRCATVKALEATSVLHMSDSALWEVVTQHPVVARRIMQELAGLVRLLSERIVELTTLDVKHRLCSELLRLAEESLRQSRQGIARQVDIELPSPPTHEAIANRIGTHREAVTKAMNQLRKSDIVARRPGALVIRDVQRLRRMVTEVTGS